MVTPSGHIYAPMTMLRYLLRHVYLILVEQWTDQVFVPLVHHAGYG